jgi:hypothetical protein
MKDNPCPVCSYNQERAELWRDTAYKLAGHPKKWHGLTVEEIHKCVVATGIHVFEGDIYKFVEMIDSILQGKNGG